MYDFKGVNRAPPMKGPTAFTLLAIACTIQKRSTTVDLEPEEWDIVSIPESAGLHKVLLSKSIHKDYEMRKRGCHSCCITMLKRHVPILSFAPLAVKPAVEGLDLVALEMWDDEE